MFKWQHLAAPCEYDNASEFAYCNFTGSDVLLIRISTKFDLDLCVTFLPLSPLRLKGIVVVSAGGPAASGTL